MAESYQATIQWSGNKGLGAVMLDATTMLDCVAILDDKDGVTELSITINDHTLQGLRNKVDELLIKLSKIEEN